MRTGSGVSDMTGMLGPRLVGRVEREEHGQHVPHRHRLQAKHESDAEAEASVTYITENVWLRASNRSQR